jgi:6-hydroxynicotinate 3-monooxygenase
MRPRLAIIGAGMGGLTLAAALHQRGFEARIYEQAGGFVRLGAGIQMSPNAMRVLRGIGLEQRIRARAFQPRSWTNREWDTGAMRYELPLGADAEATYGAPYLLMHRGDLHEGLASRVPSDLISLGKKLVDLDWRSGHVSLHFADGSAAEADAVVAADGIHSRVRELWRGSERANFTGRVAYRTTFPASLLDGYPIDECCKWWGPDRHIVIYYVTANRDEVYLVTSVPEPEFTVESWSATGDLDTLRGAFAGFHEQVHRVVGACPRVNKWAIVDRDSIPQQICQPRHRQLAP